MYRLGSWKHQLPGLYNLSHGSARNVLLHGTTKGTTKGKVVSWSQRVRVCSVGLYPVSVPFIRALPNGTYEPSEASLCELGRGPARSDGLVALHFLRTTAVKRLLLRVFEYSVLEDEGLSEERPQAPVRGDADGFHNCPVPRQTKV